MISLTFSAVPEIGAFPVWRGVLSAAQAARMGFSHLGDTLRMVKKNCFGEDHWFGNSSLAIQIWPLYMIVNEKSVTIAEVWDGENLKLNL